MLGFLGRRIAAILATLVFVSMLIFGLQGYGSWRKPVVVAVALMMASYFVVDKLDRRLEIIFVEDLVKRLYVQAVNEGSDIVSEDSYVWQVRGERVGGQLSVSVVLLGLRANLDRVKETSERFRELISAELGEEVTLRLEIIPISVIFHEAKPPEAPAE